MSTRARTRLIRIALALWLAAGVGGGAATPSRAGSGTSDGGPADERIFNPKPGCDRRPLGSDCTDRSAL